MKLLLSLSLSFEADIYQLFALDRRPNSHLLIRAEHNRKLSQPEGAYLKSKIAQSFPAGEIEITIPRAKDLSSRIATVTIRYRSLTLAPPSNSNGRLQPITVNVIWLCEENPSLDGSSPICWLLITTLPIDSLEDAVRYLRWYTYRWLIERYHFTLKSGCDDFE